MSITEPLHMKKAPNWDWVGEALEQMIHKEAQELADLLRQASNWPEVECVIATHSELYFDKNVWPQTDYKSRAWQLLNSEEKTWLKELKQQATAVVTPQPESPPANAHGLKIGDRVIWRSCPGCLESWNPFVVRKVDGDWVFLDWFASSISHSELILEK